MTLTILAALLAGAGASTQAQAPSHQAGWPCDGNVDSAYVDVAEGTGGVVMLFKPTELAGSVSEISASNRHKEVLFRASGTFAEGTHEYEIPVDSTVESIYFYAAMQCLQDVTLAGPSSGAVRADAAGVESHSFSSVRLVVVAAPPPGIWKVSLAGRGFLSLVVKAKSNIRLASVTFDQSIGVGGNAQAPRLEVGVTGETRDIGFQTLSPDGTPIAMLELALAKESESSRTYAGDFTRPRDAFRVAITGVDGTGYRFQRMTPRLFDSEK